MFLLLNDYMMENEEETLVGEKARILGIGCGKRLETEIFQILSTLTEYS